MISSPAVPPTPSTHPRVLSHPTLKTAAAALIHHCPPTVTPEALIPLIIKLTNAVEDTIERRYVEIRR